MEVAIAQTKSQSSSRSWNHGNVHRYFPHGSVPYHPRDIWFPFSHELPIPVQEESSQTNLCYIHLLSQFPAFPMSVLNQYSGLWTRTEPFTPESSSKTQFQCHRVLVPFKIEETIRISQTLPWVEPSMDLFLLETFFPWSSSWVHDGSPNIWKRCQTRYLGTSILEIGLNIRNGLKEFLLRMFKRSGIFHQHHPLQLSCLGRQRFLPKKGQWGTSSYRENKLIAQPSEANSNVVHFLSLSDPVGNRGVRSWILVIQW